MSDSSDPRRDPSPQSGQDLVPTETRDTALDAHGHDPADYKWVPVLRKPRADGWTPQRQVDFIAALAETANVAEAARAAGMSVTSCYRLRRAAPQFAAAWDAALPHAAKRLVDIAFERAINGSDEPVFDKEGNRVGRRMRQNDRLLMFLLRAYMRERFRHAHQNGRHTGEEGPPATPPVTEALLRLEPTPPPEPHRLMAPDELEDALQIADMGSGELPHWYRGSGHADAEPVPAQSLGPDFERALAAAKREASGRSPGGADGEEDGFLA